MNRLSEQQIYSNLRVFLECQQAATVKRQLELAPPFTVVKVLERFPEWQVDLMLSLLEEDKRSVIERTRLLRSSMKTSSTPRPPKAFFPFSKQTT